MHSHIKIKNVAGILCGSMWLCVLSTWFIYSLTELELAFSHRHCTNEPSVLSLWEIYSQKNCAAFAATKPVQIRQKWIVTQKAPIKCEMHSKLCLYTHSILDNSLWIQLAQNCPPLNQGQNLKSDMEEDQVISEVGLSWTFSSLNTALTELRIHP